MVERFNRTLLAMLKSTVESEYEWDQALPYVVSAYRSSVHESTGVSPFKMMTGREMRLPLDLIVGPPPPASRPYQCHVEYVEWLQGAIREAHQIAQKVTQVTAARQKLNFDARKRPRQYRVGEFVWRYYPPHAKQKLGRPWTGPYKIVEVIGQNGCVVKKHPEGPGLRVHTDALKPHYGDKPECWAEPGRDGAEVAEPESVSGGEDDSGGGEESDPEEPDLPLPRTKRLVKPPTRYDEEY